MKLTNEQQSAVDAKGHVLVSAAAGSGKTAVLTARVIDRILNGDSPVDVDKLLIVTFTSAAASEMRKRISDSLQDIIASDKTNIRAAKQKLLLESATITTIDSFCNTFVKENFQQLDIRPDYNLSSENELEAICQSALDITIDEYYNADDDGFFDLLSFLGDSGDLYNLKSAVVVIYRFTRTLPFPNKWLQKSLDNYTDFDFSFWKEIVLNECIGIVENNLISINRFIKKYENEPDIEKSLNNLYLIQADFEKLIAFLKNGDWDEALLLCTGFSVPNAAKNLKIDKSLNELIKNKRAQYKKVFETVKGYLYNSEQKCIDLIKRSQPHIAKLIEIVKKYAENLLVLKKDKNTFDFSDIEEFTLRLLASSDDENGHPTELAKSISDRYAEVLVDEYQDTNDLQNAIFNAISDNGKKLFIVGDVKQCIYNFRKANPKNFLSKKDNFPLYDGNSDPSKIILSGNFRSSKKICEFVNYIFKKLMQKDIVGMNYLDEDMLKPLGNFAEGDSDSVSIDIIDSSECSEKEDVLQAEYIASYIRNTVGKELISDNGELRPVKYSDFLILARSGKDKFGTYVEILEKAGIPANSVVENDFYKQPEIYIILNLLRAVNNPLKDIPMLAVALSPVFAVSPDEVANIRAESKNTSLYTAFCKRCDSSPTVKKMLDKLNLYRRWASSMSVSELINRIYDDTMLPQTVLATENGDMKKANLYSFVATAKGFEKNNFGGLSAFISYIDRAISSNSEYKKNYTVGKSDAVRIMTIHNSKGLQAPICFVINCSKSFSFTDYKYNVILHDELGIGAHVFNPEKRIKQTTVIEKAIGLYQKKDSISEEARLLYVAMTRAQNRLVLLGTEKKPNEALSMTETDETNHSELKFCVSYFDWLLNIVLPDINLPSLVNCSAADNFRGDASFTVKIIDASSIEPYEENSAVSEKQSLDYDDINNRLSFQYPYENILHINSKFSASGLTEKENAEQYYCTKRPAFMNEGGVSASQKGTLMHRFMEKCVFENAESDVDGEIARLVSNNAFTEKEAEFIDKDKIAAFFAGEAYSLIKSADKVLREQRFIYEMPINLIDSSVDTDETVTVQGIADCVIFKDGRISVIDYKTDRVNDENELVGRYSAQLSLYAIALNNTYSMPVDRCYIYSFGLSKTIELNLNDN